MATEHTKDPKKTDSKAAPAAAKTGKGKALTTDDLDKVSGGLNPQPLPPIVRDKQ